MKEKDLKLPFTSYIPPSHIDGWTISSPRNEGVDPEELEKIYHEVHESDELWQIRSLLVFRNHSLIAESYTKDPEDRTTPGAVWSCSKQVMAMLAGIAIENGYIGNTGDNIASYLPEKMRLYPDKASITLDNLLQMKSGIAFENDGANGQSAQLSKQIPDNSLDFILSLPMNNIPGTTFNYNDGDPHILSAILQEVTGKATGIWANEVLFSKLGMPFTDWASYKDGITLGGFGIMTTPRELAKLGQCMLNEGKWGEEDILKKEWVREITMIKTVNTSVGKSFGYCWWVDEQRGIYFMYGHGGQFVFIKPVKELMVVMTAEPNTQGKHTLSVEKALLIFDKIDNITRP